MVNVSPSSSTRSPAAMSRRPTRRLSSGCSSSSGGSLPLFVSLIGPPARDCRSLRGWLGLGFPGRSRCFGRRVGGRRLVRRVGVHAFFEFRGDVADVAVGDLVFATLQPRVADERVLVVTLLDLIVEAQQVGAQVEEFGAAQEVSRPVVLEVVHGICELIGKPRERVAHRGRAEDREHQVRARLDAPLAERLPEVFAVAFHPGCARRVEEAAQPERAVQQEPAGVVACLLHLALQDVVGDGRQRAEVAEEVADARAHDARRHFLVTLGDRLCDGAVERVVEFVGRAVETFPGIARVWFAGNSGTAREQQGERGEDGFLHGGNSTDLCYSTPGCYGRNARWRCTPYARSGDRQNQFRYARCYTKLPAGRARRVS